MPNPPSPIPAELTPIVYGATLLHGIPVKQDTRVVIDRAYAGHPILITSDKDYQNLYHVYDRRNRTLPAGEQRYLIRQRIGPSRWRLLMVRDRDEVPAPELERNYDPKRGRYKRYADQLAAGDQLLLHDQKEAIKARRAWHLYTPTAERLNLRSSVRRIPGKIPTYRVEVFARTGR
jgi:hypothetical protein